MTEPNWDAIRCEFPALAHWTYLNTATFGQLPRRATDAVARHFAHRDELACGDFLAWYDDADRIRAKIGRLIDCAPEDIAFVPNASTALGLLLAGLDWRPGDHVLTLENEFPNNLYAPGLLQRFGVETTAVPWDRFYESVNARTRLAILSSVNYNTGFAPPLAEVSDFLRARGVLLYIDGTQSLGALRFDAARIQPDMLAVHGYKWLLSPNGAGFFYIAPQLRQRLQPNVVGWRSHRDWRNVDNLHHGVPELLPSAEKYEGGSVSFALLYAMEASLDLILETGPENIERRVLNLASTARAILLQLGATVADCASPSSPHDSNTATCRLWREHSRNIASWWPPGTAICGSRRTSTTTNKIWKYSRRLCEGYCSVHNRASFTLCERSGPAEATSY